MKRLVMFFLATLVSIAGAASEYRDFTSRDGKIIRGRILAYDAAKKMVTIERDNKRSASVPVYLFSKADQAYVLEWDIIDKFRSNSVLKITCEKRRNAAPKVPKKPRPTDIHYEMVLYSRSETLSRDIRMEYNIYYEMSLAGKESKKHEQKTFRGELSIPLLKPGRKYLINTKKFTVYKSMLSSNTDAKNVVPESVHGFRARLFMKLPSGKEVMREFSYPESLSKTKYPWKR